MTNENKTFIRGYVCAVSNLLTMYDEPTIAEELLKQISVDWRFIDGYDRTVLGRAGLYKPKLRCEGG